MRRLTFIALLVVGACSKSAGPPPPHQIRFVGGAAGFPIAAAVAERFMTDRPDAVAPLVQAGGDANGIARFCGGLGARHPDLALVGRPMTVAERTRCARNGVAEVATIPIGWSAIVAATRPPAIVAGLTAAQLRAAITGPARTWREIAPALTAEPIRLEGIAERVDGIAARRDGAFRAHGADAALAADAAAGTPGSVAILPYAGWWRRRDELAAIPLDGAVPAAAAITAGRYPMRRPLLLLVKRNEARAVPGLPALLRLFAGMIGAGGALADAGLVPLSPVSTRAAGCALFDTAGGRRPPDCNN